MSRIRKLIVWGFAASLIFSECAEACTAFHLQSKDGAFIYCRSMEFGIPLNSEILIVPRESLFTGTAPDNKPGLEWKAKYGFVGMNQCMDKKYVADGMNEKGLIVGCLYLPGFTKYETPSSTQLNRSLGAWEFTNFILSSCATIQDVKAILLKVIVADEPIPGMEDFILPLHFYISDQSGAVLIVEYIGGKRYLHDNPLGVLTNAPPFNWQLLNLSNFINLSPMNVSELQLKDWKIQNLNQGTGLLGLPGDYTPPSRFVKAALFSQWAAQQNTALDTVRLGFHILNGFDIFEGIIREKPTTNTELPPNPEITQWVIVHDQNNLKSYFRSYNSLRIQMVDLKRIDFSQPGLRQISIENTFAVDDLTETATP